ncbi:DUF308 domain-containing protein [Kiritimatiellaeota bacterium B1221]|nr:DUF308 domain-containing protein [Kiritimatiellaeota bacterium B1221]
MSVFELVGILFLVMGATQSVVSVCLRKNPVSYLFLFIGVLFILTGVWMMKL